MSAEPFPSGLGPTDPEGFGPGATGFTGSVHPGGARDTADVGDAGDLDALEDLGGAPGAPGRPEEKQRILVIADDRATGEVFVMRPNVRGTQPEPPEPGL